MSESSASSNTCPRCGVALPSNATAGLCPRCLMAEAMAPTQIDAGLAAQPPLPPEQIAPHFPQLEILECLGRGGMGVVYKARQKSLNRFVALKILAPERVLDPRFAERFTHEAQALAALNHPNIITVHDFGQAGGFYYLLMEYVDGVNLRQLLRGRKFTPEEALAIVPPLCDAMQFAHERGIVHRDIKPENLLLDKAGRVKVADFGIAKMLGTVTAAGDAGPSPAPENATQATVGTPGYSAPEQKTDPQRVDSRADIYSLGVVFYEMLTGELPGKPIEPPSHKVQMDVRLDAVVLRALEMKPELRYQQVSEVKTMVETIAAGRASVPPVSGKASLGEQKSSAAPSMEPGRTEGSALTRGKTRFSRLAIMGAGFGILGVAALVLDAVIGDSNLLDEGPSLMLMAFGISLLVVSTILGWVAVLQIRRSEGKLRGMWLAVFDGLLAPLLALDVRFAWQANTIVQTLNTIDRVTSPSGVSSASSDRFAWHEWVTTALIGIVLNILIAQSVGRMAKQRNIQNDRSGGWALGLFIAGTLGALLLITTLPPQWEKFAAAFGDTALILALVVVVIHWRERLGKFLVIAASLLFVAHAFDTAVFEFRILPARQARLQADFGPSAEFALTLNQQGWTPLCDFNHDQPVLIPRPAEESPEKVVNLRQLDKPGLAIRYDIVQQKMTCWGVDDTAVQSGSGSQWNNITDMDALGTVWDGLAGLPPGCATMQENSDDLPQVIFFKTPQGRLGLLQIISFIENPPSLKIRYKLLQNVVPAMSSGQNAASTSSPAAQNLSFGPVTERVVVTNGPFVARLPQAEVELVAVGNEPWTNPVCWLPNGKLSSKPFPVGRGSLGGWTIDMVEKKIAVRIRNESSDEMSIPVCRFNKESGIPGGSSSYQPRGPGSPDAIFYEVFACPTNAEVMNVSVGIANGPWENVITLDNENGASSHAASAGDWNASYNPITGAGGDVAVSCLYSKNADWESRMVYVDGNGKVVPIPEVSSRVETGQTGASLLVSSNEFSNIREFRLQRREYQWAEFDNVSLQPGFRTTVSETFEPPIASIRPSAALDRPSSQNAASDGNTANTFVASETSPNYQNLSFSPVEELVLSDSKDPTPMNSGDPDSTNSQVMVNFDSGELFIGAKDGWVLEKQGAIGARPPMYNSNYILGIAPALNGVVGLNADIYPVINQNWDDVTVNSILKLFYNVQIDSIDRYPAAYNTPVPSIWLFRTRDGCMGMLQVLGVTNSPRSLKIRYKLVQNAAPAMPTGQNAASADETIDIRGIPRDWSCLSGDDSQWNWTNNAFYGHSSDGDSILASARKYDDVTLSAMVSTTNREASLAFRMQDGGNGYILIFGPDGTPTAAWNGGHIWLDKRQSGQEEQLAAINRRGLSAPGNFEKLTVIAKGPQIEVRLNDVSIMRTTDSTFKSGYIGLRVFGDSRCACDGVFSNVTVRARRSEEAPPTAGAKTDSWETEVCNSNIVSLLNSMPPIVEIVPTRFPRSRGWELGGWGPLDGRFVGVNQDLKDILWIAWGGPHDRLVVPGDMPTNRYDFVANVRRDPVALRNNLREQFGLVGAYEMWETNTLALRLVKPNAAGLKPHEGPPGKESWYRRHKNSPFMGEDKTVQDLASFAEFSLEVPVVDETGLSGRFDFALKVGTEGNNMGNHIGWHAHHVADFNAALLDLGLELVPTNMPIKMLVVTKGRVL